MSNAKLDTFIDLTYHTQFNDGDHIDVYNISINYLLYPCYILTRGVPDNIAKLINVHRIKNHTLCIF